MLSSMLQPPWRPLVHTRGPAPPIPHWSLEPLRALDSSLQSLLLPCSTIYAPVVSTSDHEQNVLLHMCGMAVMYGVLSPGTRCWCFVTAAVHNIWQLTVVCNFKLDALLTATDTCTFSSLCLTGPAALVTTQRRNTCTINCSRCSRHQQQPVLLLQGRQH